MSLIRNRFHYIKIFITLVNFYYMHAYPQKKNFIDIYEAICLYLERNMLNFALEFIMYVEFKYVQMKDHTFFQPEMIMKQRKYIHKIQKSSQETLGQFQPHLAQHIFLQRGLALLQIKDHSIIKKDIIIFFSLN